MQSPHWNANHRRCIHSVHTARLGLWKNAGFAFFPQNKCVGVGGDWHSDSYSRMHRCLPEAVAMRSALHCVLSAVE